MNTTVDSKKEVKKLRNELTEVLKNIRSIKLEIISRLNKSVKLEKIKLKNQLMKKTKIQKELLTYKKVDKN